MMRNNNCFLCDSFDGIWILLLGQRLIVDHARYFWWWTHRHTNNGILGVRWCGINNCIFVTALMGSEFCCLVSVSLLLLDHDDDTYLLQVAGWDADTRVCRCQCQSGCTDVSIGIQIYWHSLANYFNLKSINKVSRFIKWFKK